MGYSTLSRNAVAFVVVDLFFMDPSDDSWMTHDANSSSSDTPEASNLDIHWMTHSFSDSTPEALS